MNEDLERTVILSGPVENDQPWKRLWLERLEKANRFCLKKMMLVFFNFVTVTLSLITLVLWHYHCSLYGCYLIYVAIVIGNDILNVEMSSSFWNFINYWLWILYKLRSIYMKSKRRRLNIGKILFWLQYPTKCNKIKAYR